MDGLSFREKVWSEISKEQAAIPSKKRERSAAGAKEQSVDGLSFREKGPARTYEGGSQAVMGVVVYGYPLLCLSTWPPFSHHQSGSSARSSSSCTSTD